MWIARDKDNTLWLYKEKPFKDTNFTFSPQKENDVYIKLHDSAFKNITWENSPVEVEVKIKKPNE